MSGSAKRLQLRDPEPPVQTKRRPLSVTLIACGYILAGAGGFVAHAAEFKLSPLPSDTLWVEGISLLALLSGVFLWLGRNWARWLALAWIAWHVILSAFHSRRELAIHSLMCVVLAYFLLRPASARYFRRAGA